MMTETKIVEATGHAQASSIRRANGVRARELRDAVAREIEQAHKQGAAPDEVQARINTVRAKIAWKHDEAERKAMAERLAEEKRVREGVRERHPGMSPAEVESLAQRMFSS
jgi:hypothetical protein